SPMWKAIGSGGSTGRPKVIVSPVPALAALHDESRIRARIQLGDVVVIPAPLTHNAPFTQMVRTLLAGGRVVLTERFSAEGLLRTVERERANYLYLVPTMMSRIWKLPNEVRTKYDMTSVHTVIHMGAPCPVWLKRAWIEWLGAERILEVYAGTEGMVVFSVSGEEWEERPGTVGLPRGGEVQIRA
ncbi:AMP-binding protein, partial [Microbacterium sp. A93]|uniref:AMP-binding protein n=1 Tax=Microbacterium sp. A93 TaxID=3450716 RepID=UPI003F433D03